MTAHEKQIRSEWAEFKSKTKKQSDKIILSKNEISSVLSKIFG
jgi:hypothetical protein